MCAKSFASMLLASVFAAIASVASAASPVTYTVVAHSETNYSVVAPVAALAAPVTPAPTTIYAVAAPAPAPAPVPVTSYAPANVTVAPVTPAPVAAPQEKFAPSNEPLAPTSYLASYRANAFQALMQAVALDSQAGQQPLTADEMNLFRDAADGRAEHWTMAEAALVASGVTDRNQRLGYMAQIDQITEEAKVATANAKTPKAKAKQLIMFLLKGPMKAGYVSGQFNLRVLLDTNEFNCCSSAALFIIVGHRLNMEVAAVQRPGHIFARIPGYDVETTSGALYPSNIRAERILKGLAKNNEDLGATYTIDRPFHETGDFGSLTSMYYDTACDQDNAKDYGNAVVSYLKAACLDNTNPNLGYHLDHSFSNWFKACMKNHQVGQAAAVARLYSQISSNPLAANNMFQQLNGAPRQFASR
jgi:hypothetical protein